MVLSLFKTLLALVPLSGMAVQALPTSNRLPVTTAVEKRASYENAVYYADWAIYARDVQPQSIPADKITIMLFAFANFDTSGNVVSADSYGDIEKHYDTDSWNDSGNNAYGVVKQLYLKKKANRNFKTVLSIGGWTYRSKFAPMASTAAGRETFAKSAVKLMSDWGMDGVDVDWEYPADQTEADNFASLLQAIRDELDALSAATNGYHYLLTIATSAGPDKYNIIDLEKLSGILDHINLMGYDFAGGSFSEYSGHQANLYPNPDKPNATPFSVDKAVTDYIDAGVPANQILLGMPIYGRTFLDTAGLGESTTGSGKSEYGGDGGVFDYKSLPKSGAEMFYDDVAVASYSYDSAKKELVSFDTAEVVTKKVDYIKEKGLGGSMFWEQSGDKIGSPDALVDTAVTALGGLTSKQNNLDYPKSQYDNIKNNLGDSTGNEGGDGGDGGSGTNPGDDGGNTGGDDGNTGGDDSGDLLGHFDQCGGEGYSGPTKCAAPYTCQGTDWWKSCK